jgi:hypothetical protein
MTTAEIATAFAERGWYVLPCYPQQKIPFFPIAKQGYKSASNKPATVKKWFEETLCSTLPSLVRHQILLS